MPPPTGREIDCENEADDHVEAARVFIESGQPYRGQVAATLALVFELRALRRALTDENGVTGILDAGLSAIATAIGER